MVDYVWSPSHTGREFLCSFHKEKVFRLGLYYSLLGMFLDSWCFPERNCMVEKFPENQENTPGINSILLNSLFLNILVHDVNDLLAGMKCLYQMDKPKSSSLEVVT